MDYPDNPDEFFVYDFTKGYEKAKKPEQGWGIGRYNEKRLNMYDTPLFNNERNVHVGIDLWAPEGAPVYSFWEGKVAYMRDNNQPGDYGPTIVIRYELNNSDIYALYGHLSQHSLGMVSIGESVQKGQKIAELGSEEVNGGWAPHLHFQLSVQDPGEADMPGVVAEEDRADALEKYPDPRLVLGDLF